jgi:hypothetical protein
MKLKFIIGLMFLFIFGLSEANGQNLEADSIYRYQFKNSKKMIEDAENVKIRKPKKKTKWEYDHFHVNLTDSSFTFSKTRAGIVMKFSIIEEWDEDSTRDCLRLISAVNECGDKIWINYIPSGDLDYYVVIYYQGTDLKYYATYLLHKGKDY